MKIFLAGEPPISKNARLSALATIIRRRLFSYFYHGFSQNNELTNEVRFAHDCGMELFLDSGAYSAFTQRTVIPVGRYAAFINTHGALFSVVANLDDIGDTGARSWDNLKALESLGCKVIPVFHQQDDIQYLKLMLDNYPFIALGGLVGTSRTRLRRWLDGMWRNYLTHENGTPRLTVHGFGLTDFALMTRYPWYSLDSTSWMQTANFGGCVFFERGELFQIEFSKLSPDRRNVRSMHYEALNAGWRAMIDEWLKPHGVTAQQCASHFSFRLLVNARTYQQLEACGVSIFRK